MKQERQQRDSGIDTVTATPGGCAADPDALVNCAAGPDAPEGRDTDLNVPEERKRALYAAFASGDARFDGQVFVGVSSTGIYCRTVCSAKMPKYENCTFFHSAMEAEAAGYRPCLTCRPEIAPGMAPVDARASLARRAAAMMRESCADGRGVEAMAARLGYTGRHLRRAFETEFGVSPSQYALTCRLLMAKSLLTDSDLPVARVAEASGFGSVRRFNAAFKEHYRLTPGQLRKRSRLGDTSSSVVTVRLGYRPPLRFDELLSFFRVRALAGVELVDDSSYLRAVCLPAPAGGNVDGWVRVEKASGKDQLVVTMSDALAPCAPQVIARVRRLFDVDCDPQAVATGLSALEEVVPGAVREGTRLPGCFDPFETACRAVLGQQVSVVAANRIAERVVEAFGHPVETGIEGIAWTWPTPADILQLQSVESAFGQLGVIKTRSRSILEIARLLEGGELDFGPGALVAEQVERLLAVKGIGPWTANYIAMRVLSHPDAFLESDAGVAHALPGYAPKQRLALAEAWRPWRSYAVMMLWNSLDA